MPRAVSWYRLGLRVARVATSLGAAALGACTSDHPVLEPRDCATADALTALAINPREINVAVGRTESATVFMRGPTGPYIECPPEVSVSITDTGIAILDGYIVVKGVAPGTTYLAAEGGGLTDSVTVTVSAAVP